jgi:hypothetical protein
MDGVTPISSGDIPQILPLYTYVPGLTPHPVSHPCGHARGEVRRPSADPLQAGRALFNAGYYWEAHEVWEEGWKQLGRSGPAADFLKGFIKLAACGVKCLEGNERGARRHAKRAAQLFQQSNQASANMDSRAVHDLLELCRRFIAAPPMANEEQRCAATRGGVPVLGPLPDFP